LGHSISLQPLLPAGALKVAESGLRTAADIGRLRSAGFDAFLIGESLLTTNDPGMRLRELLGR
jgi:indole-3-glycerol phosphate synthase